MRIFISWSGEQSHRVANALRGWLPNVIQNLDPWISSSDIDKGAAWLAEIDTELETTKHGIVCIVPGNEDAPWLNYEAGALAKQAGQKRVCVSLLGVSPSDLSGPLRNFQATLLLDKNDVFKLLTTLNGDQPPETQLKTDQLLHAFDREWPLLETMLTEIQDTLDSSPSPPPARTEREILEEVLAVVRTIGRSQASDEQRQHRVSAGEYAVIRDLRKRAREDLAIAAEDARFPRDTAVTHANFGVGIVINSEGSGKQEVASVFFPGIGIKRLLVSHAPIELFEGEIPPELRDAVDIL